MFFCVFGINRPPPKTFTPALQALRIMELQRAVATAAAGPKFSTKEYDNYARQQGTAKFSTPELEYEWASTQFKDCSKCGESKRLVDYNGNTSGRDAFDRDGYRLRRPECTDCTRTANRGKDEAKKLAKSMGIAYKAPPGTPCAICRRTDKPMVFDHCHKNNVFRGYLCDPCNRSLGVLGDDIEGLLRCINYLQHTEKKIITQNTDLSLTAHKME